MLTRTRHHRPRLALACILLGLLPACTTSSPHAESWIPASTTAPQSTADPITSTLTFLGLAAAAMFGDGSGRVTHTGAPER